MWQVIWAASIIAGTWYLAKGKNLSWVESFFVLCGIGSFGFAAGIESHESDLYRAVRNGEIKIIELNHIERPEQECTGARFTEAGKC